MALCPEAGGNLNASYEEVLAKLARTKVGLISSFSWLALKWV